MHSRRALFRGLELLMVNQLSPTLFFVDDNLMFEKASKTTTETWELILHRYKLASRQVIHFQKSLLCMSLNVLRGVSKEVNGVLKVGMLERHSK